VFTFVRLQTSHQKGINKKNIDKKLQILLEKETPRKVTEKHNTYLSRNNETKCFPCYFRSHNCKQHFCLQWGELKQWWLSAKCCAQ